MMPSITRFGADRHKFENGAGAAVYAIGEPFGAR